MRVRTTAEQLRRRLGTNVPGRAMHALWSDETAPTAVEYALLVGGIAIVIVASAAAVGTSVAGVFSSLANQWP